MARRGNCRRDWNDNIMEHRALYISILMAVLCGVCAATEVDLSSDVILYWKLDDNAANKTIAAEVGGAGTAYRNTSLTSETGKLGLCYAASDNADYVWLTVDTAIDAEMTFALWFKTLVDAEIFGFSSRFMGVGTRHRVRIFLGVFGGSEIFNVTCPGSYDDGLWHFVVATATNGEQRIYLDNILLGEGTNSLLADDFVNCGLAAWQSDSGNGCSYDNFTIFDKILTVDEIAFLYNLGDGTEELSGTVPVPVVLAFRGRDRLAQTEFRGRLTYGLD